MTDITTQLQEMLLRNWRGKKVAVFNEDYWETWASDGVKFLQDDLTGDDQACSEVMDYLRSKGFPQKGQTIIDLGCGTGRYTEEFAGSGACVTGMDVSSSCCEKTMNRVKRLGLENVEVLRRNIFAYDPEQEGMLKKYDLVFSNLMPGAIELGGFRKIRAMSRGACYISYLVETVWPLYEEIVACVVGETLGKPPSRILNLLRPLNLLCLEDCFPEVTFHKEKSALDRPVNQRIIWTIERIWPQHVFTDEEKEAILEQLRERTDQNGLFHTDVVITVGSLFWTVGGEL